MANLLENPGFEVAGATASDADSWSRSTFAARVSTMPRSGSWSVFATKFGFPSTDARLWQSIATSAGILHQCSAWVKRDSGLGGIRLVDDETVTVIASIDGADATGDWQLLSGYHTPGSALTFVVETSGPETTGAWYVDDCIVEESDVPRHLSVAITALTSRLALITGSGAGYYHDLSGRVYAREIDPQTDSPSMPCASVILANKPEFEPQEGRWIRATITPTVIGFIAESDQLDAAGSSQVAALNFIEDVTRALMPAAGEQWNLGSAQIEDIVIDPRPVVVGLVDQREYAIVPVDVRVSLRFSREDLGPSA